MGGYGVVPDQLRSAAGEIAKAIGAADDTNLEDVAGKGSIYGDDKVFSSLSSFCTTWELAKQILQQRSASAGQTLESTAKVYEAQEQRQTAGFGAVPVPTPGPSPVPSGAR